MFDLPRYTRLLIGLLCLAYAAPLLAEEPAAAKQTIKKPGQSSFLRIQRDAQQQPLALETATVRYVPSSGNGGLTVDLIGVVHIGDRGYYSKLNKQMEQYDVLLYELVAPPGTRIPKGGKRSDNPLAMIQQIMKTVLQLESQTEQIDYTKKNFVHADLSPDQMAEAMRDRGENGLTLFLNIAADMIKQQNLQEMKRLKNPPKEHVDVDLFSLLLDPAGPIKMKRLLAQQFEALESPDGGLGNTLHTLLVADRNKAALKVFQKELAKGKKKIGIFYGAAHMPDFERRLREDYGLKRDSEHWLAAWNLRNQSAGGLEGLFKLLEP